MATMPQFATCEPTWVTSDTTTYTTPPTYQSWTVEIKVLYYDEERYENAGGFWP